MHKISEKMFIHRNDVYHPYNEQNWDINVFYTPSTSLCTSPNNKIL